MDQPKRDDPVFVWVFFILAVLIALFGLFALIYSVREDGDLFDERAHSAQPTPAARI